MGSAVHVGRTPMTSPERLIKAPRPSKTMASGSERIDLEEFREKIKRVSREYWRYAYEAGKKDP